MTGIQDRDPQAVARPFHPQGQEHLGKAAGVMRPFGSQDPQQAQGREENHPEMAVVEHVAGLPHGHGLQPVEVGPHARSQSERQRQGRRMQSGQCDRIGVRRAMWTGTEFGAERCSARHGTSLDRVRAGVNGGFPGAADSAGVSSGAAFAGDSPGILGFPPVSTCRNTGFGLPKPKDTVFV